MPLARRITRSLQPEQRAKWERWLAEGPEETEDYPAATPDQRAAMAILEELKDAESIIAELAGVPLAEVAEYRRTDKKPYVTDAAGRKIAP